MFKKAKKTICDTCIVKSCKYEFYDISTHTFVITGKAVKEVKKTICDTCALKSQRYEFSDISGHTAVISRKTVK